VFVRTYRPKQKFLKKVKSGERTLQQGVTKPGKQTIPCNGCSRKGGCQIEEVAGKRRIQLVKKKSERKERREVLANFQKSLYCNRTVSSIFSEKGDRERVSIEKKIGRKKEKEERSRGGTVSVLLPFTHMRSV